MSPPAALAGHLADGGAREAWGEPAGSSAGHPAPEIRPFNARRDSGGGRWEGHPAPSLSLGWARTSPSFGLKTSGVSPHQ